MNESKSQKFHMPLWLQAMVEILQNGVVLFALFALPSLAGWGVTSIVSPSELDTFDPGPPLVFASRLWLAGHGVPLQLGEWTWTLVPLGVAWLVFALSWRSGKRLMAAARGASVAVAWAFGTLTAALCGWTAHQWAADGTVGMELWHSLVFPACWVAAGMAGGILRAAGTVERLLGMSVPTSRPAWRRYGGTVLGATLIGMLGCMVFSALAFSGTVLWHWAEIANVYEKVDGGILGTSALTAAHAAMLPNALVWTLSWLAGPGFALGTGTLSSPAQVELGPLPLLPMLAGVPREGDPAGLAFLIFPVVAGIVAGWWFWRGIPIEFDRFLAHQIDTPWVRNTLSAVCSSLLVGTATGLAGMALAWLSSGSAGPGRLGSVGPSPEFPLWLALEVAFGVLLGHLVAPWFEKWPEEMENDEEASAGAPRRGHDLSSFLKA